MKEPKKDSSGKVKPWTRIGEFGGAIAFKKYMRQMEGDQYIIFPLSELEEILETATKIRVGNMRTAINGLTNTLKIIVGLYRESVCKRCLKPIGRWPSKKESKRKRKLKEPNNP